MNWQQSNQSAPTAERNDERNPRLASVGKPPYFERVWVLGFAFTCGLVVLLTTSLMYQREWMPAFSLSAVMLTLLVVLPLGEFIRNRFRMSLRSGMLLVTIVTILMGLFAAKSNEARLQRRAVRSVLGLKRGTPELPPPHASVDYHRNSDLGRDLIRTSGGVVLPSWLVAVFGDDFFFEVRNMSIQHQDLSADDALSTVELSHFEIVHFYNCKLGPGPLKQIVATRSIRDLSLIDCGLDDDDLKLLSTMQQLRILRVGGTWNTPQPPIVISDTGIQHLARLANLEQLDVSKTAVTSRGLAEIATLPKLEYLELGHTGVSNEDVGIIAAMDSLRGVGLRQTQVDESSIARLQTMPNLEWATLTPSSPEVTAQLHEQFDRQQDSAKAPRFFFH